MKILYRLFYKFTCKDYIKLIDSATMTHEMIMDSTSGKSNHFYNSNGTRIRGFHKHIRFTNIPSHPLIQQYK